MIEAIMVTTAVKLIGTLPSCRLSALMMLVLGNGFAFAENSSCARFCSSIETPIAVIRSDIRGAERSGLYAIFSITIASTAQPTIAATTAIEGAIPAVMTSMAM